ELVERLPEADKPLPPLVGLTGFGEEAETNEQDPATDKTDEPAGKSSQPTTPTDDPPAASDVPAAEETTRVPAGTTASVSSNNFLLLPLILIAGVVLFGTWFVIGRRG
ncbi:MAG TPA: hypothetical protein DER64_18245, partial [Planctomycetaceae bacterium]|nr:hypothetical protein [Planctomycetaceae bacterium]